MEQILKIKSKIVKIGSVFYIISEEKIKIGDAILDFEASENGYSDVIRKCEDENDEKYVNQEGSGYRKIISDTSITNWVWREKSDHEYRFDFNQGFVEPMDNEIYERIYETGGKCFVLKDDDVSYTNFIGDGKIIFIT
jgi:hypothetical protein